jgi:hypothetical protein
MNASDQTKVNHINQLESAMNKLSIAQGNLYDLNYSPLNQAGNNQWSGKNHDDFITKYDAGNKAFGQAPDTIDDMIQEYQQEINNIAWSIEDIPTRLYYGIFD